MGPQPAILDVDPGHDDAVAIMMACGSPGLDLLAVTTVAGNAMLPKTTRNALCVLSLIDHTEIPVAAGAWRPLERELRTAVNIHGESGMGGSKIPEASSEPDGRGAFRLIADTLRESPESVVLIPVGPLTDIAKLLREHPELKDRISRISLGGGSIGLGNTTPAAEFNAYVDPEAAREVFESGLPITMSGLDITHQAGAGKAKRDPLQSIGGVGGVIVGSLNFFATACEEVFGFGVPPLHGPVAVAAILEPGLLTTAVTFPFTRSCPLPRGRGVIPQHSEHRRRRWCGSRWESRPVARR